MKLAIALLSVLAIHSANAASNDDVARGLAVAAMYNNHCTALPAQVIKLATQALATVPGAVIARAMADARADYARADSARWCAANKRTIEYVTAVFGVMEP